MLSQNFFAPILLSVTGDIERKDLLRIILALSLWLLLAIAFCVYLFWKSHKKPTKPTKPKTKACDLPAHAIDVLEHFATNSGTLFSAFDIKKKLNLTPMLADSAIDQLSKMGFIIVDRVEHVRGPLWEISANGRSFVLENKQHLTRK